MTKMLGHVPGVPSRRPQPRERARAVQRLLTDRGEHHSAGPVDLLLAATAELSGLTPPHRDRDFETIARLTGQPTVMLPS